MPSTGTRSEAESADKSTGERTQEIEIYLKYVGKLEVPMPELTPEELAEEERKRRKRAWNRTYNRRKAEKERIAKEKAALEAKKLILQLKRERRQPPKLP